MGGKTGKLVAERSRLVRQLLLSSENLSPLEIIEKIAEIDRKIRERDFVASWTEYLEKQKKETE